MESIISQIAGFLWTSDVDVYFIFFLIAVFAIFCFLGITKIYEILFWLVLWIAIFIMLQFLLTNPNVQVPEIISQSFAKFIVWSSIYLIFLLSFLVPLNSSLSIKEPKNAWIKVVYLFSLAALVLAFYLAILTWFIEKTYIFNIDSAFIFLKKLQFWAEFSLNSKYYIYITKYVPEITLFGIFFVIYRLVFNDIVNMFAVAIIASLGAMIKKWWGPWGWGWSWHDDHDDHDDHGWHGHH